MSKVDQAVDKFLDGYACSQAVASTFAAEAKCDTKDILKISSGFSAGMRMGGTCGAVTGAYMLLGLYAAGESPEKIEERQKVYGLVQRFTAEFESRNGHLNCCEILGCNISNHEGMEQAKRENLFKTKCPKLVKDAAEIVEKILKEEQETE